MRQAGHTHTQAASVDTQTEKREFGAALVSYVCLPRFLLLLFLRSNQASIKQVRNEIERSFGLFCLHSSCLAFSHLRFFNRFSSQRSTNPHCWLAFSILKFETATAFSAFSNCCEIIQYHRLPFIVLVSFYLCVLQSICAFVRLKLVCTRSLSSIYVGIIQ